MWPPVRIEPGTYDFKPHTLLSEETWVPGSILTEGNILLLEFFVSRSKDSDANIVNFV